MMNTAVATDANEEVGFVSGRRLLGPRTGLWGLYSGDGNDDVVVHVPRRPRHDYLVGRRWQKAHGEEPGLAQRGATCQGPGAWVGDL